MAFKAPSAERKPILACVGYVSDIGAMKRKDGSPYCTIPLAIKSMGSYNGKPGMDIKVNLSFLPEFFSPTFDPDHVSEATHGEKWRGVKWSYEQNFIAPKGKGGAMLQCICGDQETFERLGAMVDALPNTEPDTIYEALTGFLRDIQGTAFGYVLRQPNKKTDEVDEAGKPVYEVSQYYEVDQFFRLTEDNVKKLVKRAEQNAAKRADDPTVEKFLLRFEPQAV
jgi:hypothetical protein